MDIIDKINALLNEKGITGAQMSRDLGFSNAVYSQWNTGKQKPSAVKAAAIAEYLEVSTDYLLGKTDTKNKPAAFSDGLSEEEKIMAEQLMSLSPEQRKIIQSLIDTFRASRSHVDDK